MRIGFIGLGNMGAPMALNLLRAGHDVRGFDVSGTVPEGIAAAASAADVARGADVVITMLPNGQILRTVAAEVIPAMRPGAVLCDCSTVDVDSARAVAADAAAARLGALDAPVSGGIGGAAAGTLTFMVGGPDDAFETVRPLFEVMGQKAVHCGAAGAGQALQGAIQGVNEAQQKSGQLAAAFERGDASADLAKVMVASQQSSLAFRATVEVRNRLVQAYQDVMNMPL